MLLCGSHCAADPVVVQVPGRCEFWWTKKWYQVILSDSRSGRHVLRRSHQAGFRAAANHCSLAVCGCMRGTGSAPRQGHGASSSRCGVCQSRTTCAHVCGRQVDNVLHHEMTKEQKRLLCRPPGFGSHRHTADVCACTPGVGQLPPHGMHSSSFDLEALWPLLENCVLP